MNNEILNELFDANTFVQTNSYILSPYADSESTAAVSYTHLLPVLRVIQVLKFL